MSDEFDVISPREGQILKLVIGDYIKTAEPVSSLYVTRNHSIGLSSATIRSVLAELEGKGFLFSPHRSSGRIPTERGYRYFVSDLPGERSLPEEERRLIQEEYLKRDFQLNQILDVTCRILGMLTNYVGVVTGPEWGKAVLKHIELIDMGQDEVLIILVARSGRVYSKTLYLENRIPQEYLRQISAYLNNVFKGCDLAELKDRLSSEPMDEPDFQRYYPMIAESIVANFDAVHGEEELYTSGLDGLLTELDGSGDRIRELGGMFESGNYFQGLFTRTANLDDVMVLIQGDQDDRLDGISLVLAHYKMGEKTIGSLGVVGPNRMDYYKVVSLVDFISRLMSSMITRISN